MQSVTVGWQEVIDSVVFVVIIIVVQGDRESV